MSEIGERVRIVRKTLGLTLEDFGKGLGVGKTAISNIENGNRSLTEQMAKAICREYGINYFWLTKGEGEMFFTGQDAIIDAVAEQYNLSDVGKSIVTEFLKLPPATRNSVEQYILNIAAAINNNKEQP